MLPALITLGPLTTVWTAPASCLSTTTQWGNWYSAFFIGYQPSLGVDADCFPSHKPTATASATAAPLVAISSVTTGPTPTIFVTITGYTTVTPIPTAVNNPAEPLLKTRSNYDWHAAYYSPGICPSGYTYAVSYTDSYAPWAVSTPAESGLTRYFCCPSGYTVQSYVTSTTRAGNLRLKTSYSTSYRYPDCSLATSAMPTVWSMTPGWPATKPTSYSLTSSMGDGIYGSYSVYASGVVVGWSGNDQAVQEYLQKNNITVTPIPGPIWINNADVKAIVGTVIGLLAVFFLCCACYICSIRARQNTKKGKSNGNDSSFQTALLREGERKPSTEDQHALESASNIVTSNVVVMGPVSNITVTGGNAQQALEEHPPKYGEGPST